MSFPGVIRRPLLADEFSIYLDNARPIPLSALVSLLGKIDKAAQSVEGMQGFFLELSDFALGSSELRFRVVGPGRASLKEQAEREERLALSAESTAASGKVAAGAAVVTAVVAAVGLAMTSGAANAPTYRIVNQYNVQNIYLRAPQQDLRVITREQLEQAREQRLSAKDRKQVVRQNMELKAVHEAMEHHRLLDLAGWFHRDPHGGYYFETMNGNRLPAHWSYAEELGNSPVAVRTIVHGSPDGPQLEVIDLITKLADY